MKLKFLFPTFFCLTINAYAASPVLFNPAVLNAALLFSHDPSSGKVKHSLQWIRNSAGELQAMTDVWYDRNGCFTRVNMVDKISGNEFHIENNNGNLTSRNGQQITGKVNQDCHLTELENDRGKFLLSYNSRGLLETMTNRETGDVSKRFEYRYGQFPVRIRDYQKHTDKIISYPAGNPQFLDFESSLKVRGTTVWLKQSCSYQPDGNARLCSIITAYDDDYRDGATVMFTNHQTEYY